MNTNKTATICLPTNDLERAYRFYLEGIGLALESPELDGNRPEPVVFKLNDGFKLMLVPTDGFDHITPGNKVADSSISECVIALNLDSSSEVDAFVEKARKAGAIIPEEAGQRDWGYVGYFKDQDGHIWTAVN